MLRTVNEWVVILRGMSPTGAANRIFGDLIGYRDSSPYKDQDVAQAGNALRAFAELERKHHDHEQG